MNPDYSAHALKTIPRYWVWLGALALAAAVALAYTNSFAVPFVFDDTDSILKNNSLHDWRTVLFPPSAGGETVGGRPLLNISLALNYAISGTNVWSYHLFNLLIHLAAGLALFGLVRRALAGKAAGWSGRDAFWCALAAAAIWLLHPLQTESVTYIVQRAESLMAMWYLLTLYCFSRIADLPTPARHDLPLASINPKSAIRNPQSLWLAASVLSCALGMATKEVMVSAPVLVLLYDRAFVAGSFRETFRARWKFYAVLASTWLVLAACLLASGSRGGTVGAGSPVAWWVGAITQCKAILVYLKLVFWPSPLVFDYGMFFIMSPLPVLPHIIAVTLLAASTLYAIFRWPRAGIFGALFFAVLAPTSSVIPVLTQTMAEHRMYLPLAALVVPVVAACHWFARRRSPAMLAAAGVAACAVALTLGVLTYRRNQVYQNELSLWTDTAQKAPQNWRAQSTAGIHLIDAKRHAEGIARCLEAARLNPDYAPAWCYAGAGLLRTGRFAEAVPCLEKAATLMREHQRDHPPAAQPQRGAPDIADLDHLDNVYLFLAMALHEQGRDADARAALAAGVAFNPENAYCLNNLANSDYAAGDYTAAETHYRRAITVAPEFVEAHEGLAGALEQLGRNAEARAQYEHALRLAPTSAHAHYYYARLLARLGDTDAARAHAREALRLQPDYQKAAEILKTLNAP